MNICNAFRYCDSLDYALKSRRAERINDRVTQRKYYELMLKEDSDVALLRVFECFLEAAPQQILQVAIVLVERGHGSTFQRKSLWITVGTINRGCKICPIEETKYCRTALILLHVTALSCKIYILR